MASKISSINLVTIGKLRKFKENANYVDQFKCDAAINYLDREQKLKCMGFNRLFTVFDFS